MQKGSEAAQKLLTWYQERLTSLERRRALLDKGMVALDSAVHEQKLNFIRAQVTEMTRRISALLVSNEKGFPNHSNLIRNAVPATTTAPSTAASGSGGSNTTTASSGCSTPDANGSAGVAGQAWLQVQNARLAEELDAKSRLIEQLQREKMYYDQANYVPAKLYANPNAAIYAPIRSTPTAYVRPAHIVRHAIGAHGLPSPVKRHDTLL
uniref:Uncharacterized protein n=1 Tax=Panagrellus redivivus TaxID=6233 RepID=A0A7E4ZWJ6_PANRE